MQSTLNLKIDGAGRGGRVWRSSGWTSGNVFADPWLSDTLRKSDLPLKNKNKNTNSSLNRDSSNYHYVSKLSNFSINMVPNRFGTNNRNKRTNGNDSYEKVGEKTGSTLDFEDKINRLTEIHRNKTNNKKTKKMKYINKYFHNNKNNNDGDNNKNNDDDDSAFYFTETFTKSNNDVSNSDKNNKNKNKDKNDDDDDVYNDYDDLVISPDVYNDITDSFKLPGVRRRSSKLSL